MSLSEQSPGFNIPVGISVYRFIKLKSGLGFGNVKEGNHLYTRMCESNLS